MTDEVKNEEVNPDESPSLEQKVKELETKLNNQNESTKRIADSKKEIEQQLLATQNQLKELEKAKPEPKEDSARIAELELRLARSEAVAEYGLDPDDVAIFRGTPEEIKEQAAHFASKLSQVKTDSTVNKTGNVTTNENVETHDAQISSPPPVKKKELSMLDRYKRATPEERRKIMEKASRGEIDLTK